MGCFSSVGFFIFTFSVILWKWSDGTCRDNAFVNTGVWLAMRSHESSVCVNPSTWKFVCTWNTTNADYNAESGCCSRRNTLRKGQVKLHYAQSTVSSRWGQMTAWTFLQTLWKVYTHWSGWAMSPVMWTLNGWGSFTGCFDNLSVCCLIDFLL